MDDLFVKDVDSFSFSRPIALSPDQIRRDVNSFTSTGLRMSAGEEFENAFDLLRLHPSLYELILISPHIKDEPIVPVAVTSNDSDGPQVIQLHNVQASFALTLIQLARNLRSLSLGRPRV